MSLFPAHAGPRTPVSEVDAWLSEHSAVAGSIIWEFPPETSRTVEIKRIHLRPFQTYDPLPIFTPPLTDSVLPELDRDIREPRTIGFEETTGAEADIDSALLAGPQLALEPAFGAASYSAYQHQSLYRVPGGINKSEYGAEIRAWNHWPDWAKEQLRARYTAYRTWLQGAWPLYEQYAASGFTAKPEGFDDAFSSIVDMDPSPVLDPPQNLQPDDPLEPGVPWSMVDSFQAFALYVRLVAAQLAMEIGGHLDWSLEEYGPKDLMPLFDGRSIFRYVPAGPSTWGTITATGHIITTTVTPAPPLVVLGFLAQNGMVGDDRLETLVRFLDWERENLFHVAGGTPANPLPAGILYWGYNGRSPVSRIMNGTIMSEPIFFPGGFSFFDPELRNWVGGCGGASGFNGQVLRLVNVAAEQTAYGHFQNRFGMGGGVSVALAHADDPYGIRAAPEIPTEELLLDDATFQTWLVAEPDPVIQTKNVSRRTADLHLQYLPEILLYKHCLDTLFYGNDHAASQVYGWCFSATYTVEEMEMMGLWTGIEAKLESLGGCSGLFGF